MRTQVKTPAVPRDRSAAPSGSQPTGKRLLPATTRIVVAHLLSLLALDLLIFRGVFLSGDSFPFDFPATYYALPAYWISSVAAGEWPSWVPYLGMGFPFAAHPQSGAFYPPLWVFPLLHIPYTLARASVLQALHVYAGAVGAYALVWRLYRSPGVALVAGAAYLTYGGFYSNAEHPDIVRAFALAPWLFWAALLSTSDLHPLRIASLRYASSLSWSNLLLPAVVYLLITGAYIGNTIAFLFALPFFLVLQALRNLGRGQTVRSVGLDLVLVAVLIATGLLLSAAFLVPLLNLSGELTRSSDYLVQSRWYLQVRDFYELALSSQYLRVKDHSMFAMQLPLALLPFGLFLRKKELWQMAPLCAAAVIASIMSFDVLSSVSNSLIRLIPPLGFSRFPSGDYRTLIALPVLVALCGGLAAVHSSRVSPRVTAARFVLGLIGISALLLLSLRLMQDEPTDQSAVGLLVLQMGPSLLVGGFLFAARRPALRRATPTVVAVCCALSASPVLLDMRGWWQMPAAEAAVSELSGVDPWSEHGWLPDDVFRYGLSTRPERKHAQRPEAIAWRGYLAGEFMSDDYGGAVLKARQNVERDADLRSFMDQSTALLAMPCSRASCVSAHSAQVPLRGGDLLPEAGFAWRTAAYGRSFVHYQIALSEEALVIENELYSGAWRGRIDRQPTMLPVEVDGALRGWVLPAGEYDLVVSYETPLLGAGLVISSSALAAYALLLAFPLLSRRAERSRITKVAQAHARGTRSAVPAITAVYCNALSRRLGAKRVRWSNGEPVD
jgi:hypothetical protein